MKPRHYKPVDLNNHSTEELGEMKLYLMKEVEFKGEDLVKFINQNPGLDYVAPERIKLKTLEECAEVIVERNERATLDFKIAQAVQRLIKKGREKGKVRRRR